MITSNHVIKRTFKIIYNFQLLLKTKWIFINFKLKISQIYFLTKIIWYYISNGRVTSYSVHKRDIYYALNKAILSPRKGKNWSIILSENKTYVRIKDTTDFWLVNCHFPMWNAKNILLELVRSFFIFFPLCSPWRSF